MKILAVDPVSYTHLSMEQRMACGVGACLGCAIEMKGPDGCVQYGHVCKDGPVFDSEVIF